MNKNFSLYTVTFAGSLVLSLILTPAARAAALLFDVIDHPHSHVKTHKKPVPYLGGAAIFLSFALTLLWIRVLTSFPTGTLRSLRGILFGGALVFLLGLTDDVKHLGLHYRTKFLFQALAALLLIIFGIHIKFVQPSWLGFALTFIWVVGITNALNLIDIMDGLASGLVFVSALAFLFISLPTEAIYVNFASAALAGATLGFIPYNLSEKTKIFMGDGGSLFVGFVAGALALGTSYEAPTNLSLFSPLLILGIPIFDTIAVFIFRIRKGKSPFLGSKDHYPLRLEKLGWTRPWILVFSWGASLVLCISAYASTQLSRFWVLGLDGLTAVMVAAFYFYIARVKVE